MLQGPRVPKGHAGRPHPILPLSVPVFMPSCDLPPKCCLIRADWDSSPSSLSVGRPQLCQACRPPPGRVQREQEVLRALDSLVPGGCSPALPLVECRACGLLGAERKPGDDGADRVLSVAGVGCPSQAPASPCLGDACRTEAGALCRAPCSLGAPIKQWGLKGSLADGQHVRAERSGYSWLWCVLLVRASLGHVGLGSEARGSAVAVKVFPLASKPSSVLPRSPGRQGRPNSCTGSSNLEVGRGSLLLPGHLGFTHPEAGWQRAGS